MIDPRHLQHLLREVTDETFNMITVDGDCSTNDMVLAMASGRAGHSPLHPDHPEWAAFRAAFAHVARELAKMIARDGEGATRLVEVKVTGAASREMARRVAKGVPVQPGQVGGLRADANWKGFCAIGYADPVCEPRPSTCTSGTPVGKPARSSTSRCRPAEEETVNLRIDLHQATGRRWPGDAISRTNMFDQRLLPDMKRGETGGRSGGLPSVVVKIGACWTGSSFYERVPLKRACR